VFSRASYPRASARSRENRRITLTRASPAGRSDCRHSPATRGRGNAKPGPDVADLSTGFRKYGRGFPRDAVCVDHRGPSGCIGGTGVPPVISSWTGKMPVPLNSQA
jgi:hypothetical protein